MNCSTAMRTDQVVITTTRPLNCAVPAIEICIDATDLAQTRTSVENAYAGGADRIELCASMHIDGLTPAQNCIETARTAFLGRPGMVVMIRPRGGHFFYDRAELEQMRRQIAIAADAGANGVALGALTEDSQRLDTAMAELVSHAKRLGLAVTLHRAFDATPAPHETLETAIALGVDRILSSGSAWGSSAGAMEGLPALKALCQQAKGRIEIVAAGAIGPENAAAIVQRLTQFSSPVSLHSYSGAQKNGVVSQQLVRSLKRATSP
jgi:copper homeostasis protein